MKYILLNLKRFDIPVKYGGVNRFPNVMNWAEYMINEIQGKLVAYSEESAEFYVFLPEAHIIPAVNALKSHSNINIGCQSVHRQDVLNSENFGAFTTHRTATSMVAIGCSSTIIGHLEERRELESLMGHTDVNSVLNEKIKAAQAANLKVVYCIGEKESEKKDWKAMLKKQISTGLSQVNTDNIIIAYEPVWSIGPGKKVPTQEAIQEIIEFIKEETGNKIPVVYGGGMKQENAKMLASITELDGGLIALTRFSGEIGFYPEEFLDIVEMYMKTI